MMTLQYYEEGIQPKGARLEAKQTLLIHAAERTCFAARL
jgi:hypothetical protein